MMPRSRTMLLQATTALVQLGVMTPFAAAQAAAAPAGVQAAPQGAQAQEPGSELRVYLMTIGQGDFIYEKFGHNAIWIRDESRGVDVA